jgi:hypothetical protein
LSWDPFQRAVLTELGLVPYQTCPGVVPELPQPDAVPATSTPLPPPRRSADAPESAMLARLARAAGCPVEVLYGEAQVLAMLPRLRTDPAAKRALWPYLRRLRRRMS